MQSLAIVLCICSLICFVGFFAVVFTGHLRDDDGMYAYFLVVMGTVFLGLAFVTVSLDALASNPDEETWRRHGQQDLLHFGWFITALGAVQLAVLGGIHLIQAQRDRTSHSETTRREDNHVR